MDRTKARQLMLDVGALLDQLQVPFFLMQGTALGAYRDKDFTPTERDIDLGVLQENLTPSVWPIVSGLISNCYDVEMFTQPFNYVRTIVVWGIDCKLDLVGWTKYENERFTATPVREWIAEPYAIVHDAEILENYQQLRMFGRSWNVPLRIRKYLALEYGPNWEVPKEDHESRTRVYDYLHREGIV